MRIRISLDDDLVAALDDRVGRRQRSRFIAAAIRHALDEERRWDDIVAGLGALEDSEHAWDADASGWVRDQRRVRQPVASSTDALERRRFFDELTARYEALRQDAEAWAEIEAERAAEDGGR